MSKNVASEFEIIETFFAPLAEGEPGSLNLKDDAAILSFGADSELIITTDTLVAGVHYFDDSSPEMVASKLLRVNLSDLAAMGAEPWAYTLSLAIPGDKINNEWLQGFVDQLRREQQIYNINLIGGDTVATPGPLTLTVTALGRVQRGKALRRDGARPGDSVYVSGTIGDAALGLKIIQGQLAISNQQQKDHLIDRHRIPRPRVNLGLRLAGLAHAATDVSDGLLADLGNICVASNVGALIKAEDLPLSDAARAALAAEPALIDDIFSGGDDYEVLFAGSPNSDKDISQLARDIKLPLTKIGQIVSLTSDSRDTRVRLFDKAGDEISIKNPGYNHFQGDLS